MSDDTTFSVQLGQNLKQARRAKQLTQKQLAAGICAQSLISAIEAGDYLPNAVVFARLCQRLGLSMDQAVLAHYPEITQQVAFNRQVEQMCNQHDYRALADYLATSELASHLITDRDLAIFYYYRGVANYQGRHDASGAQRDLKLSLTLIDERDGLRPLILSASGCFNLQAGHVKLGQQQFEQAQQLIAALPYDENFNCVAYQLGLCQFKAGQFDLATQTLQAGVQLITKQQSHYLLADTLVLMAAALDQRGEKIAAQTAQAEGQLLAALFKLQLYQF